MVEVWNTRLEPLTKLSVTVHGSWHGPYKHKRDWHGVARASQPLVALVLVVTQSEIEWVKSDPEERDELDIRLALFPYDAEELDVQVNFSVGGGQRRNRSLVPSPTYMPNILTGNDFETGQIVRLSTINGEPRVDVGVLFLAKRDVTVVRRRIWRIRKALLSF